MDCTQVDRLPDDPAPLETLLAPTAGELVAGVRTMCAEGRRVVVEPDDLCAVDGAIDVDEWTALVSVLVHEGVAAIRTIRAADARRLFDLDAAIRRGDLPSERAR